MRRRSAPLALLVAAAVAGLSPRPAQADHTEARRELDYTAYVLHHGEVRAGVTQIGVGLFGALSLETTVPVWLLAATYRAGAPNLYLKWQMFERRGVSLGFRGGFAYVVGRNTFTEGDKLRVLVTPFALPLSWRVNPRWTVSFTPTVSHLIARGNVPLPLLDVQGDTVGDNVHFTLHLEYRLDRHLALQAVGQYLPYRADAVVGARAQLSERTAADLSVGVETPEHTGGVQLLGAYSWKKLELRAGAGWGSYFAFGSGLVLTRRTPYPVFDLYYRY